MYLKYKVLLIFSFQHVSPYPIVCCCGFADWINIVSPNVGNILSLNPSIIEESAVFHLTGVFTLFGIGISRGYDNYNNIPEGWG